MPELDLLNQVRIASPCPASWTRMRGDDQVRFCEQCQRNVYNLSAMTRPEAERLILEKEGRLCARYYQRADGTLLTQDCPVGLRRARLHLVKLLSAVAACFAFVAASLGALAKGPRGSGQLRLRQFQPFTWLADWFAPPPAQGLMLQGAIAMPQLTPEQLELRRHELELQNPVQAAAITEFDIMAAELEAGFKERAKQIENEK